MHEMALCTEVAEAVLKEAEAVDAVSVNRVDMVIGEMRDIVEDLFDGFFRYLVRGTIAENCIVSFARVPVAVVCHGCGERYRVDMRGDKNTACPQCGQKDFKMVAGMEFMIESIDVTTRGESGAGIAMVS